MKIRFDISTNEDYTKITINGTDHTFEKDCPLEPELRTLIALSDELDLDSGVISDIFLDAIS